MADTNDTLCYATNDNQQSVLGLIETEADLAFVIGGYNSSNTTHLAELLEKKFNTYFISSAYEILSQDEIRHFDIHSRELVVTKNYLPRKEKVRIAITSGASCPDSIMEEVILKILSFYPHAADIGSIIQN